MDSITHALTGAVIAKAIDDEKIGNWGTIAGFSMGFFPDTDFVLGHRVEFMDVRFLFPNIRIPFVYYVEFDDSGKTRSEGFVGDRMR